MLICHCDKLAHTDPLAVAQILPLIACFVSDNDSAACEVFEQLGLAYADAILKAIDRTTGLEEFGNRGLITCFHWFPFVHSTTVS